MCVNYVAKPDITKIVIVPTTKTDNNDLPKVLTDVEDVKGNVFLLKDGTLNLSYAIGGITPIAIDTNVSKLIGNLSMTTTDPNVDHSGDRYHYGVQYIKGDNLMYARRDWELGVGQKDSFILHNRHGFFMRVHSQFV